MLRELPVVTDLFVGNDVAFDAAQRISGGAAAIEQGISPQCPAIGIVMKLSCELTRCREPDPGRLLVAAMRYGNGEFPKGDDLRDGLVDP